MVESHRKVKLTLDEILSKLTKLKGTARGDGADDDTVDEEIGLLFPLDSVSAVNSLESHFRADPSYKKRVVSVISSMKLRKYAWVSNSAIFFSGTVLMQIWWSDRRRRGEDVMRKDYDRSMCDPLQLARQKGKH